MNEFRTDDLPAPRADGGRTPTVSEMYERSVRASRDAWRTSAGDMPRARHDATDPRPGVRDAPPPAGPAERIDVAAVPKITDLYERHRLEAANRWRNAGDKPGQVPAGGAR